MMTILPFHLKHSLDALRLHLECIHWADEAHVGEVDYHHRRGAQESRSGQSKNRTSDILISHDNILCLPSTCVEARQNLCLRQSFSILNQTYFSLEDHEYLGILF